MINQESGRDKIVSKLFATVFVMGTDVNKNGKPMGWFRTSESHPYSAEFEAERYIAKHADLEGFQYGTIEKRYITEKELEKLLSKKEESLVD